MAVQETLTLLPKVSVASSPSTSGSLPPTFSLRVAGVSVTVDGEVKLAPLWVFVPVKLNWQVAERTIFLPSDPATDTMVSDTALTTAQLPVAVGEVSFG